MKEIIENKVKEFLYNEIFNLEGMEVWELREKYLDEMYDVIEKEVDKFIKKKDWEDIKANLAHFTLKLEQVEDTDKRMDSI